MKDAVMAELTLHAADELRHATMISGRIIQLGGTPILHPGEWLTHSNCGYDAPTNPDVRAILDQAISGEQCAITTYSNLLELVREKDIVTYDLVSQILADEVEHEEDLQSLFDDIEEFITQFKQ
jgi:bacterioferritin